MRKPWVRHIAYTCSYIYCTGRFAKNETTLVASLAEIRIFGVISFYYITIHIKRVGAGYDYDSVAFEIKSSFSQIRAAIIPVMCCVLLQKTIGQRLCTYMRLFYTHVVIYRMGKI